MKNVTAVIFCGLMCSLLLTGCPDPQTEGEAEGEALPYECSVSAEDLWAYEGETDENGDLVLDEESQLEVDVFAGVNQKRLEAGLSELVMDPCVWYAAQLHSRDLAHNDYCDHTNLDGKGVAERLNALSIPWAKCAEVLCCKIYNTDLDAVVVARWMNSADHEQSILNSLYTHGGVGVARDELGNYYFTHILTKY